jgi:hypothetical protein
MFANGLTGLQVLLILVIKIRHRGEDARTEG